MMPKLSRLEMDVLDHGIDLLLKNSNAIFIVEDDELIELQRLISEELKERADHE